MAPMTMSPPSAANAFELGDGGEIDQICRRGQPQLHHRDKAVTAGERAAVVAQLSEQRHRILDGGRTVIGESARYHWHPPWRRRVQPEVITGASLRLRNTDCL